MQIEVGATLEGKITGITNFGAFVQMEDGKTGLVHISEVALTYVKDIHDHLKEGDAVKVKVLSVDENGKVSLSIKKALEDERKAQVSRPAQVDFGVRKNEVQSFEDMMKSFMSDSEEKISALKRNQSSKRSGGYKR